MSGLPPTERYRTEHDSMGEVRVPASALWRAQTQRAVENFPISGGTVDSSLVWALVQPRVAKFTRVCSYDRGGYLWSDPGARPRTYAQLALELRTALTRSAVRPPYVRS